VRAEPADPHLVDLGRRRLFASGSGEARLVVAQTIGRVSRLAVWNGWIGTLTGAADRRTEQRAEQETAHSTAP